MICYSSGREAPGTEKMRNVYKAPIAETNVPAIVDYLVKLNATK